MINFNKIILFLIIFLTFGLYAYGQKSDVSWDEDVIKRGFKRSYFLFEDGSTRYYSSTTMGNIVMIIAIHNIGESDKILDVEIQKNGSNEWDQKIIFSKEAIEKFHNVVRKNVEGIYLVNGEKRKKEIRVSLRKIDEIWVSHYVKNVFLPIKPKTKFRKEKPIIATKHYVWESNNIEQDEYGWSHEKYKGHDRIVHFNSISEATDWRKNEYSKVIARNKETKELKKESSKNRIVNFLDNKLKRDSLDAKNGFNPSNTILSIFDLPRGQRDRDGKLLLGQSFNSRLSRKLDNFPDLIDLNEKLKIDKLEKYFKDIFYGNFKDLSPEKVNESFLGTYADYFPDFHNSFLYYSNLEYGDNYFPNLVSHSFSITEKETKNGVDITPWTINYKVYFPSIFLPKFKSYLKSEQFHRNNFYVFKDLILSFLETYDSNSLAFKQMTQNLYRYANGLEPVKTKKDLLKF